MAQSSRKRLASVPGGVSQLTEEDERRLLSERIAAHTDREFVQETLEQLRWIVERLEYGAHLTAQKGRLAALSYATLDEAETAGAGSKD